MDSESVNQLHTDISDDFVKMAERISSNEKEFSLFVSSTLDCMGYSESIVHDRRQLWKSMGDHVPIQPNRCTLFAGSKGEGVTSFYENDIDNMRVYNDVVCAENVVLGESTREKTVFKLDMEDSPPGYTRLMLIQKGNAPSKLFSESLFESDSQEIYMDSDTFIEGFIHLDEYPLPRSGPADRTECAIISQDLVPSFPCHCPSILNPYLTRTRHQRWPDIETLQEISASESHVVAVGFKNSERRSEEWRICYTKAELALVKSFDDAKTKLLILLKFVAKDILKAVVDGVVTSYIMKNLIWWMCELTPRSNFELESLTKTLCKSLKLLRIFLRNSCFPNYIIPKRNLFSGNLNVGQRHKLVSTLTELIDEGPCMLFRCGKLKIAMTRMYSTPEVARREGEKKDVLERLTLLILNMMREWVTEGATQSSQECLFGLHLILVIMLVDTFSDAQCPNTLVEAMVMFFGNWKKILS